MADDNTIQEDQENDEQQPEIFDAESELKRLRRQNRELLAEKKTVAQRAKEAELQNLRYEFPQVEWSEDDFDGLSISQARKLLAKLKPAADAPAADSPPEAAPPSPSSSPADAELQRFASTPPAQPAVPAELLDPVETQKRYEAGDITHDEYMALLRSGRIRLKRKV